MDFWQGPFDGKRVHHGAHLSVILNEALDESERVTVLKTAGDGRTAVAMRSEVANRFSEVFASTANLDEDSLLARFVEEGIILHGADNIYYLSEDSHEPLLTEPTPSDIRQLGDEDAAQFAEFQAGVSEQDLDDAQVELDDWAVFGVIGANGRILSAGSMYPWQQDSKLADIGVLTRTDERGRGHARRLVRAMCRHALNQGYEPQYRCQLDNVASNILACAAGLTLFGQWQIVTPAIETGG
ncbi:GNAT family N-acetyltransferase [Paeniglutamicibacter sp. NPDC091659]|uniref:GNAT family N-acetyltransferase n=1 Tax=Paeniglutamicibacter sp. NPDC091659 TaxID=3364389 RepID=UPI00381B5560